MPPLADTTVAKDDKTPIERTGRAPAPRASAHDAPSTDDLRRGLLLERAGNVLIFGGPLLVFGAVSLLVLVFPQLEDMTGLALLILASFPLGLLLSMYGAFKLAYLGKQYQARGRARALEVDTRAPVVYLRPFATDESLRAVFSRALGQGVWPRFGSFEEQLSQVLEAVGPLEAIGMPGEALPTPGAARRYAGDTEWKSVVESWLASARLVILRPGFSEGLWWELRQAVGRSDPGMLLILILRMRRPEYQQFAERVRTELGKSLPPFETITRWRAVNGFIRFGPNWEPAFLPLRAPLLRGDVTLPQRALFHHALRPVFEALGVPWQPAPLSTMKLVYVVVMAIAFVLMFFGWLFG
jgi:hypothetical protein